jgi:UDP-N-acetylglucosamine acyltransferase
MSAARIDPTARVADGARLAADVEIGPYCIIGPGVELKSGVRLHAHVCIAGVTVIGERSEVYPFVSLGTAPQAMSYAGEPTRLVIGKDGQFREGVTICTGTEQGGGVTTIGDRCFMMSNSHIGHDCVVGNDVTFANNAVLGGHVCVGDHVFLGGQAAVHQFVQIGDGAMIGGVSGIAMDVIPFGFALGQRAVLVGLNVVGLRRRGYARDDIHRLRRAHRSLFLEQGTFAERLTRTEAEFRGDPLPTRILDFVRAKRARPLMMAAMGKDNADSTA